MGTFYRSVHAVLRTGSQLLRGRNDRSLRNELELSQFLEPAALADLQWRRLGALLIDAYAHVPFYRARLNAIGLRPEDIHSWEDFERIPVLTRNEIRSQLPQLKTTARRDGIELRRSGGSTGVPMEFYQDAVYYAYWRAARARSQSWYGFARGDRVANISAAPHEMPGHTWSGRLRAAMERQVWLNAFRITDDRLKAFADNLVRWRPEFIVGYPAALHIGARFVLRAGVSIRPRAVQSFGEQLWPFQRTDIQMAFGCPVVDFYGSRESAPIAAECLSREGLHAMTDLRVVELLDDQGVPVRPGEAGRVVITDLTNYSMPLIRYANDDLATWKLDSQCSCGRTLPLLSSIDGRTSDMIRTKSGVRIHGFYFMYLFYNLGLAAQGIEQYQVRQRSLEDLEILIKPNAAYRDAIRRELEQQIDAYTNSAFRIDFRLVDEIPATPSGKHRFTLSDLANE